MKNLESSVCNVLKRKFDVFNIKIVLKIFLKIQNFYRKLENNIEKQGLDVFSVVGIY